MNITLNANETAALRQAFQMYQKAKRQEAAANRDSAKSKKYADLLGVIETLQAKIGYPDDVRATNVPMGH